MNKLFKQIDLLIISVKCLISIRLIKNHKINIIYKFKFYNILLILNNILFINMGLYLQ